MDYNNKHGIVPTTISKNISDILFASGIKSKETRKALAISEKKSVFRRYDYGHGFSKLDNIISGLEEEMYLAAQELDFEKQQP